MKLPDEPKDGFPVRAWARQVLRYLRSSRITSVVGGRIKESPNGSTLFVDAPSSTGIEAKKEPLRITLKWDGETPEIWPQYGHVVPRHNASADAGAPIEITDLPTKAALQATALGEKFWVKLTISIEGKCTIAEWKKGTSWPTDVPPVLVGGDLSGTEGQRYVRIGEIIADPDHAHRTIVKQLHTGHIDHFQPTLADNTVSSYSTGLGGVLVKLWNAAAGRWDFRSVKKGNGQLTHTQEADAIEIRGNKKKGKLTYTIDGGSPVDVVSWVDGLMAEGADEEDPGDPVDAEEFNIPITTGGGHPWKVTNAGSGNAAIAAGYVLGYYLNYPSASPLNPPSTAGVFLPDDIVLGPGGSYGGGTIAITGTQYIYAEVPKSSSTEYSESRADFNADPDDYAVTVELYNAIEQTILDTATLVVSSTAASGYAPTTGYAAVCIAKVTNTGGVITVDDQYVTHNPTMFVPIAASVVTTA